MDNKVVFVIAKKLNGHLAYADKGLKTDDVLTLLAMVTEYTYQVAKEKIGLTEEEILDNVNRAVEIGIAHAKGEADGDKELLS